MVGQYDACRAVLGRLLNANLRNPIQLADINTYERVHDQPDQKTARASRAEHRLQELQVIASSLAYNARRPGTCPRRVKPKEIADPDPFGGTYTMLRRFRN